ncbi:MAG: hypothetical protein E6I87_12690, partial [Chloroflexi bacterium]
AVNGYTTDDLIREELSRVSAFGATLTSLLIGANDIVVGRDAETFRSRLRAILASLRTDGVETRRLIVVSAPDWSGAPQAARFGDPARVARVVDAFAAVAREEAERVGARFFDIVPLSRSNTERGMFANDRLHFSADASNGLMRSTRRLRRRGCRRASRRTPRPEREAPRSARRGGCLAPGRRRRRCRRSRR